MQAEFWHERWRDGRIGFHLPDINPHLKQFWPSLGLPADSRVLAPLCGKSLDLLWLAQQGHEVVGVELSPIATEAFFDENGLTYSVETRGSLRIFRGDAITLIEGDIFELAPQWLGPIDAVYDRAALVALPPAIRSRYAGHLRALAGDVPELLITLEYDNPARQGPPFTVTAGEVEQLFGNDRNLHLLHTEDLAEGKPEEHPPRHFVRERIYRITPQEHD